MKKFRVQLNKKNVFDLSRRHVAQEEKKEIKKIVPKLINSKNNKNREKYKKKYLDDLCPDCFEELDIFEIKKNKVIMWCLNCGYEEERYVK